MDESHGQKSPSFSFTDHNFHDVVHNVCLYGRSMLIVM